MAGEGWGEGHSHVPHRRRCRRHLYRPRRGRRFRKSDPGQGPLDPDDPSIGVLAGLQLLADTVGVEQRALLAETERIVHGTTVATNALIEHRGARVGLLTTEGHRDVIEMREGLKDDRYNLRLPPPSNSSPAVCGSACANGCAPTAGSRRRSRSLARPRDRGPEGRTGRGGGGVLSARLA